MAERMLKFVDLEQRLPPKRPIGERRTDFGEIYREFEPARAREQASRCSQCGVPFCHNCNIAWCPLSRVIVFTCQVGLH